MKIATIDIFPCRYPTVGYFKFFVGPRSSYGRAAVAVKVTADDGTVGWGQSVPVPTWTYETLDSTVGVMRDFWIPALIGRDPTDLAGANHAMDQVIRPSFTTGMPLARAGLDIALHDLTGRLLGKSLPELWGRKPLSQITLSWTINARTIDEVEPLIAQGRERGYEHFNIKVAPDIDFDVRLAKEVRRLVPDGFLWADANGGYTVEQALQAAPKLADAGVEVLESPIPPNELSGYIALRKLRALPILMDEGIVSPVELREFIKLGMLDGIACKPARCGGLASNKAQIELIEKHGLMWLGSGLADPDIALTAALQLYAAYGLKKPAALNGPQFLDAQVLKTPLAVEGGKIEVPTGPGLGIEVDEQKLHELVARSK